LVIFSPQATALLLPGSIRIGPLRLTVYGIIAAAGLIAALWLSQRTAPRAGLPANKLWDAGVIAIVAAFVTSRALLIAFDLRAFLKYPLLVLSLPSLTYAGMVLTALLVWLWLRRKHLPVRDVLDVWAPCAALLAAVLALAHFVEGTDAGMPTRLPWGVITPGDTVLGRVHPVQIYAAVIALALCTVLFRMLPRRKFSGQIAAVALITGGLSTFLLDLLQQPVESSGDSLLDPGQFVALAAMLVGAVMYRTPKPPLIELTRDQVAVILEQFADGGGGDWDWDAYMYEKFSDPTLAQIQGHCMMLPEDFPTKSGWCNDEGLEVIRQYARQLRSDGEQSPKELT
jgi:phosphatidylglycerol---prolipoprotein diacylglyceryl transferase